MKNFNPLPENAPTPLKIDRLEKELMQFPDRVFVSNIIRSFKHGFDIGYNGPEFDNISVNLKSADSHSSILFQKHFNRTRSKTDRRTIYCPPIQ